MIWDPALLDCAGNAESPGIIYRVKASRIVIAGWALDAEGQPVPLYAVTNWSEVDRTSEPASGYVLPDPPVGEISIVDVEATDAAGNMSEDCP